MIGEWWLVIGERIDHHGTPVLIEGGGVRPHFLFGADWRLTLKEPPAVIWFAVILRIEISSPTSVRITRFQKLGGRIVYIVQLVRLLPEGSGIARLAERIRYGGQRGVRF